jgi:hypothetical protein
VHSIPLYIRSFAWRARYSEERTSSTLAYSLIQALVFAAFTAMMLEGGVVPASRLRARRTVLDHHVDKAHEEGFADRVAANIRRLLRERGLAAC